MSSPGGLDSASPISGGPELTIDGAVATVMLNRPERRNAMTPAIWLGLARTGDAVPEQVRVVVVRGAGPSFCAGIDLRLFSADGVPGEERPPPGETPDDQTIAGYQAGYRWLRNPQFVSIAAVQGHAIG